MPGVQGMPVMTPFKSRPTRLFQQFSIVLAISLAHINSKPVLMNTKPITIWVVTRLGEMSE